MGNYYGKHLAGSLKDLLTDLVEKPHHEQVSLYEELGVARTLAIKVMGMSSAVLENAEASPHQKAVAISAMRESLDHVRDLVLATSRIEREAEDKVSVRVLDLFVLQICKALKAELGEDTALCERAINRVRDIRMPAGRSDGTIDGTTITPDQAVLEMDRATLGVEE